MKCKDVSNVLMRIRRTRRGEAKATDQYEVKDENAAIFQEVNEEEYEQMKKNRNFDNFIEGKYSEEEDEDDLWNYNENFDESGNLKKRKINEGERKDERKTKQKLSKSSHAEKRDMKMKLLTQHFKESYDNHPHKKEKVSELELEALRAFEDSLDLDGQIGVNENEGKAEEEEEAKDKAQKMFESNIITSRSNSKNLASIMPLQWKIRRSDSGMSSIGVPSIGVLGGMAGVGQRTPNYFSGGISDMRFLRGLAANCSFANRERSTSFPRACGISSSNTAEADHTCGEVSPRNQKTACEVNCSASFSSLKSTDKEKLHEAVHPSEEPTHANQNTFSTDNSDEKMKENSEILNLDMLQKFSFIYEDSYTKEGEVEEQKILEKEEKENSENKLKHFTPEINNAQNTSEMYIRDDGNIEFFFIDAFEEEGTLLLFGKVMCLSGSCVSCCVVIKEVMRNLFFKPKAEKEEDEEEVTKKFFVELKTLKEKYGIKKLMFKPVSRNYAFDKANMKRGENQLFFKVCYPATYPPLNNNDLQGAYYTHVFGNNTSLVELFLLKRCIRGPSWLIIKDFSKVKNEYSRSTCKHEIVVANHKSVYTWGRYHKSLKNADVEDAKEGKEIQNADLTRKEDLKEPNAPSLTVLSFAIKTMQNEITLQNQLCLIGMIYKKGCDINDCVTELSVSSQNMYSVVHRVGIAEFPCGFQEICNKHGINIFVQERGLIASFLNKILEIDPDVLLGHNIHNNDLSFLVGRCSALKLNFLHKLSRLRKKKNSSKSSSFARDNKTASAKGTLWHARLLTVGRLLCDTYLQAKELLKSQTNYELYTLVKELLPEEKIPKVISQEELKCMYNSAKFLHFAVNHTLNDAFLTFKLMLKLQLLPLTRELTNIAGNLWIKSLQNARSERNEFLLLHEFHAAKFVCPDKVYYKTKNVSEDYDVDTYEDLNVESHRTKKERMSNCNTSKGKDSYVGGLVLKPKTGFYDKFVILLDFNSLYPSIIQEYNICFTTVVRPNELELELNDFQVTEVLEKKGILPNILKGLVNRRNAIKKALKKESNSLKKRMLDVRQLAIKLVANSIYGCLGFQQSRFYAKPIAAFITQKGRSILLEAKRKVEDDLCFDVIYGDTDSIMVNTGLLDDGSSKNYYSALKIAAKIKELVNRNYRTLEIDLDGTYKRLLLLKKKKYACVKVIDFEKKQFSQEMKGLDIVRRDWCPLTKELGTRILEILFSDNQIDLAVEEIHEMLTNIGDKMNSNKISIDKYIITKSLTRSVKEYVDVKPHPHVQVAIRLEKLGLCVKQGNEIPYIICSNESINDYYNRKDKGSDESKSVENVSEKEAENGYCLNEMNSSESKEANVFNRDCGKRESGEEAVSDGEVSGGKPQKVPEVSGGNSQAVSEGGAPNAAGGGLSKGNAVTISETRSFAERAYHPEEVKRMNLRPDILWYKAQQLHPPIARLCEYVDGTDSFRIATCLGLDGSKYQSYENEEEEKNDSSYLTNYEAILQNLNKSDMKYKNLQIKGEVRCSSCNGIVSPITMLKYMRCSDCKKWLTPNMMRNWLSNFLWQLTFHFSKHLYKCKECGVCTQRIKISDPLSCPQASCCASDSLIPFMSPAKAYRYLEYLLFLLADDLTEIESEEDNNADHGKKVVREEKRLSLKATSVMLLVNSDGIAKVIDDEKNSENPDRNKRHSLSTFDDMLKCARSFQIKAKRGIEIKFPNILKMIGFSKSLQIALVDYNQERKVLRKMVENIMKINRYSRISISNLFEVFKSNVPNQTSLSAYDSAEYAIKRESLLNKS